MGDPGQTAVNTPSRGVDRAPAARDRDPRMSAPRATCYGPGLEHRSPGPIDVIAALAERFAWPAPAPRLRPSPESPAYDYNLHLHEKMG
jgi:hypothetical protein